MAAIMGKFDCQRCGKSFPKNQGLTRHLARKTPCVPNGDKKAPDCANHKASDNRNIISKPDNVDKKHAIAAQAKEMEDIRAQLDELKSAFLEKARQTEDPGKRVHTINIFGNEKFDHISPAEIRRLLNDAVAASDMDTPSTFLSNVQEIVLKAAMLIYCDEKHPENITCYIPNKKRPDAMVHGVGGWEIRPCQMMVDPMTKQAIKLLFDKQPWEKSLDERAEIEKCGRILRYLADNERHVIKLVRPDMNPILINNKDRLNRILSELPVVGEIYAPPEPLPAAPVFTYVPTDLVGKLGGIPIPKEDLKPFTVHDAKAVADEFPLSGDLNLAYAQSVLYKCADAMGADDRTRLDAIHRAASKFYDASREDELFDEASRKMYRALSDLYDANKAAFAQK